jgi:hypothetical protein
VKQWEKQEKDVARRRNGSRQPGSGSGWLRRNDVREAGVLWEMKSTGKTQITVKKATWQEMRRNALLEGRMPALHLDIDGLRLVVISEDDFDEKFPPEVAP